jgi:hypothetical protein
MAQEAVLAGRAVEVETARDGGEARLRSYRGQVGPLPGGGIADDEEPTALAQHEQPVEGVEHVEQVAHRGPVPG